MATRVEGLYIGKISVLGPEGQLSGIFKRPVGTVNVSADGFEGDHQADRRVHGGPEKAIHHYAAENYALLAASFPAIAQALVPGQIGENVSTQGWTEDDVHLGDVFRIGAARVQVSQPRSPCWKINHRFDVEGLSKLIAETGRDRLVLPRADAGIDRGRRPVRAPGSRYRRRISAPLLDRRHERPAGDRRPGPVQPASQVSRPTGSSGWRNATNGSWSRKPGLHRDRLELAKRRNR